MKKLLLSLMLIMPAYAMQTPSSPIRSPKTPKEYATCAAVKLFNKEDKEVVSVFTRIISKDKKGNTELFEMRWRILQRLEELECAEDLSK